MLQQSSVPRTLGVRSDQTFNGSFLITYLTPRRLVLIQGEWGKLHPSRAPTLLRGYDLFRGSNLITTITRIPSTRNSRWDRRSLMRRERAALPGSRILRPRRSDHAHRPRHAARTVQIQWRGFWYRNGARVHYPRVSISSDFSVSVVSFCAPASPSVPIWGGLLAGGGPRRTCGSDFGDRLGPNESTAADDTRCNVPASSNNWFHFESVSRLSPLYMFWNRIESNY